MKGLCDKMKYLYKLQKLYLKPWYSEQVRQTLFVHYIEKFTISNEIRLVNPQNRSCILFTISRNSLYRGSLYQGLSVRIRDFAYLCFSIILSLMKKHSYLVVSWRNAIIKIPAMPFRVILIVHHNLAVTAWHTLIHRCNANASVNQIEAVWKICGIGPKVASNVYPVIASVITSVFPIV